MKKWMIAASLTAALSVSPSIAGNHNIMIGPAKKGPPIVGGIVVPVGGFIIQTNGFAERLGNGTDLSSHAFIYVTVTDREGRPITDLGPTKGFDGSNKPKVPVHWVVRNLYRNNVCVLKPVGFKNYAEGFGLEYAPGAYRINAKLSSQENAYCTWDSKDRYAYVVQLRSFLDVVGMALGELIVERPR
jgi:hypothetical protein